MRLLQLLADGTIELVDFPNDDRIPKYAILSHTWLEDNAREVVFEDMSLGSSHASDLKPHGYEKIVFCGEQAAKDGLEYFWVDTCCIRKESSAEMQEAITSMFAWYRNAVKCYVYLTDVSVPDPADVDRRGSWEPSFRLSRWFTRGWTLQELLAPSSVEFFSGEGTKLGDRVSLENTIHDITGIPRRALQGDVSLQDFTVEDRLSWAKNRDTKRKEDRAYCLMGILNIFMTLIYGEGDNAFKRLRTEIERGDKSRRLILDSLPVASQAAFNSINSQHQECCLNNTRVELLGEIEQWIDRGPAEQCIFWLSGIAGTGKSTVARTIATAYDKSGRLGASFFFSRGGGDLTNAKKLVTTLAKQLATKIPAAEGYIYAAILKNKDIADYSLRDQWQKLIVDPLSLLQHNRDSSPSTLLLVIDALDECDNEKDVRLILSILPTSKSLRNLQLRILVTSRPEVHIRSPIARIPEGERQVFVLHEISSEIVDNDLNLFFEDKLSAIRHELDFEDDWPGVAIVKRLVATSSGLFIWASTACRWIHQGKRAAQSRIKLLLQGSSTGEPAKQLNQIYTTVLQVLAEGHSEEENENDGLKTVLSTIIILLSPLPMGSIAKLCRMPLQEVKSTLAELHTIFHIPREISQPIRAHHPSFRDFLVDKDRCSDPNFWVDEKQAHRAMADNCLALMAKMLKPDMCGLKSPGTLLKDVDPDRIEQCIPPELQYACLYWAEHYRQGGARLKDDDKAPVFFKRYFPYWLEVMSLLGKSAEMDITIRMYHALLVPYQSPTQVPFAKDARRFMFTFQSIIKLAPLQTYSAALAFVPATNDLRAHFRSLLHPWIREALIAKTTAAQAKDEFAYVNDIAFTPDGKWIASGTNIEVARLWDVKTKAAICKFEGPTDKVSSVAISPDGRLMACGADDWTVVVWDVGTGAVHYHLNEAHVNWVNSVDFSPDGQFLVSGSMDQTVAIWDALTGRMLARFDNQSSGVNASVFSPDGELLATCSVDQMVRLWDVSGLEYGKQPKLRHEFYGHSGSVNCVRFSPDGQYLVSGSEDMTVKRWDAANGTELLSVKAHTQMIRAVAFSPDASLLISGSGDMTVRVWDATSGTLVHELKGHTTGINAVAFSPDGKLLASCSYDDEIRFWDARTWEPRGIVDEIDDDDVSPLAPIDKEPQSQAHSSTVTCLVSSVDDQFLASGSADSTIKVWVPSKGAFEHCAFTHGSSNFGAAVNHLAFSPDGCLLASASADQTIKLWDAVAGGPSLRTLEGHTDGVLSVVFSPDGKLLASRAGPADITIKLWDVETGKAARALDGHVKRVNAIAFSPDNRFFASCSTDKTIMVWKLADLLRRTAGWMNTNALKPHAVLRGHSMSVNSVVFSHDGELLVSCSDDGTIRFWEIDIPGVPVRGIIRAGGPGGSETQSVRSVAISPPIWDEDDYSDENSLIVASCSANEEVVRLWDVATASTRGAIDAGAVVNSVSFPLRPVEDGKPPRYIITDRGWLDIATATKMSGTSSSGDPLVSSFRVLSMTDAGTGWVDLAEHDDEVGQRAIFATTDWLRRDGENAICLPEEYRPTAVASCTCKGVDGNAGKGQVMMLGHSSGAISFIYM